MTPVLCLNCGKARSEHYTHLLDDASKLYCHKYSTATWRPPLDESVIDLSRRAHLRQRDPQRRAEGEAVTDDPTAIAVRLAYDAHARGKISDRQLEYVLARARDQRQLSKPEVVKQTPTWRPGDKP